MATKYPTIADMIAAARGEQDGQAHVRTRGEPWLTCDTGTAARPPLLGNPEWTYAGKAITESEATARLAEINSEREK